MAGKLKRDFQATEMQHKNRKSPCFQVGAGWPGPLRLAGWLAGGPARVAGLLVWVGLAGCVAGEGGLAPQQEEAGGGGTQQQGEVRSGAWLAGIQATRRNELGDASRFLNEVRSGNPASEELQTRLFQVEISRGRLDAARALINPDNQDRLAYGSASVLLLVDAIRNRDTAQLQSLIESLSDHGLSNFLRPLSEVWREAFQGDWPKALEKLARVDRANSPVYLRQAALVHDLADKHADAEALYLELLQRRQQLSHRDARLVANFLARTGNVEAMETLAARWERENALPAAFYGLYFSVPGPLEPAPGRLVATPGDGFAELMIQTAESLSQARIPEAALSYLWLGLELNPDQLDARMLAGRLLVTLGRFEEAETVYRQLMTHSRIRLSSALNLALTLEQAERKDDAGATLARIEQESGSDRARIAEATGDLHYRDEQYQQAIGHYSRAVETLRASGEALRRTNWRLLYRRAIAYERTDQWMQAEQDFLEALELSPDQPQVLNYLAYSWLVMGKHLQRSHAMLVTATDRSPNDGYIVDSLGWSFYVQGKYEEAVKHLERAVELVPYDAAINDHLGDAYYQVGRRHEAGFQWSHALKLDPEPELRAKIERKLETGSLPAPAPKTASAR